MSVDSIVKTPPTDSSVRKLGHYIVKETLGEGGFSKVKLGVHEKTGEKVALKLLKNKSKLTKPVRKQVEREIAAMSQIDHPNVLRMKDVDWECVYTKKNGKKTECYPHCFRACYWWRAFRIPFLHWIFRGIYCSHLLPPAHGWS
jgi:serine/threonine protein kinase